MHRIQFVGIPLGNKCVGQSSDLKFPFVTCLHERMSDSGSRTSPKASVLHHKHEWLGMDVRQ